MEPGEQPYPELMNRAAVAEILARDISTVIVKGDRAIIGRPKDRVADFLES